MFVLLSLRLGAILVSLVLLQTVEVTASQEKCKCIPGDDCWPTLQEWADFNTSISGRLVVPRQLAYVCHNPDYDEAACAQIQEQWTQPGLQLVFYFGIQLNYIGNSLTFCAVTSLLHPLWLLRSQTRVVTHSLRESCHVSLGTASPTL